MSLKILAYIIASILVGLVLLATAPVGPLLYAIVVALGFWIDHSVSNGADDDWRSTRIGAAFQLPMQFVLVSSLAWYVAFSIFVAMNADLKKIRREDPYEWGNADDEEVWASLYDVELESFEDSADGLKQLWKFVVMGVPQ